MLIDVKGEIDSNTSIVGDFNTSLTPMNRCFRKKISKATEILNDTIEHLNAIYVFRTLYKNKQTKNTNSFQV